MVLGAGDDAADEVLLFIDDEVVPVLGAAIDDLLCEGAVLIVPLFTDVEVLLLLDSEAAVVAVFLEFVVDIVVTLLPESFLDVET